MSSPLIKYNYDWRHWRPKCSGWYHLGIDTVGTATPYWVVLNPGARHMLRISTTRHGASSILLDHGALLFENPGAETPPLTADQRNRRLLLALIRQSRMVSCWRQVQTTFPMPTPIQPCAQPPAPWPAVQLNNEVNCTLTFCGGVSVVCSLSVTRSE